MEVVQASPVKIPEPGTAAECANNTVLPVTVADAAYLGNLTTVRKFLSDGGAVDALCPARDNGTLLMAAAVGGHAGLTRLLLNRRANIELQNSAGLTPLMGASQQVGNTEVIEMLIRAGAQVERSNPRDGATAILYAAERGDADAAQALLKAGANVDAAKMWRDDRESFAHIAELNVRASLRLDVGRDGSLLLLPEESGGGNDGR